MCVDPPSECHSVGNLKCLRYPIYIHIRCQQVSRWKNVKKNVDGVYIHDAFLGKYPCLKLLISFVKFPYSAMKS